MPSVKPHFPKLSPGFAGGCVAALACNEGSGSVLRDISGNNRDLTIRSSGWTGNVVNGTWGIGEYGHYVNLGSGRLANGIYDYDWTGGGREVTILIKCYPKTGLTNRGIVDAVRTPTADDSYFRLGVRNSTQFYYEIHQRVGQRLVNVTATSAPWTLVWSVTNASVSKVWGNGSLLFSDTTAYTPKTSSGTLGPMIGSQTNTDGSGRADETELLGIWDRGLPDSTCLALSANPLSIFQPSQSRLRDIALFSGGAATGNRRRRFLVGAAG